MDTPQTQHMDDAALDAYLARIGYDSPREPTLDVLKAVHLAQSQTIAFENFEPLLNRPVPIDLPALQDKLIAHKRGGYCFEINTLFCAALRALGFVVTPLLARVQWMAPPTHVAARTHMVLRVDLNGTSYIADAGFGAVTLTGPIILQTETPQRTPHEMFRLIAMGADELQLQVQLKNEWVRMYQFSLVPPPQIDFEVGNFFVWAYPESHFRKVLMASHVEAGKRFTLGNLTLTTRQVNGDTAQHEIETSDEFADVLRNVIGTQISKADAEAVFEKLKSV